MAVLTPQEIAEKWKRNVTAAIPSYKAGIMAVTVSPMQKAAAQADRYVEGVRQAAESGKWQAGLLSRTLQDWQQRAAGAGAERITRGAMDAVPAVVQFQTQLAPVVARIKQAVAAMPKGSTEDSIARAATAIRMMKDFSYRKART